MIEGIRVGKTSAYGHVSVKGGGRSGAVRGDVMESDGVVKGLLGLMLSGRGKKKSGNNESCTCWLTL